MRCFIGFLLVSLITSISGVGLSPVFFLEEGGQPGRLGMAGAGYSREMGQMFANPAFLYNEIGGRTFSLGYLTSGSLNENLIFAGYGVPSKYGKLAFGFTYTGNSGLIAYDAQGNFDGNYNTSEILIGGSHIWQPTEKLTIAETVKVFSLDYSFYSSTALGADLSGLYRHNNRLAFGASIRNLVQDGFRFANVSEPLPVVFEATPVFTIMQGRSRLYYTLRTLPALYAPTGNYTEHRIGFDVDMYKKYLSLRAGTVRNRFSFGLGSQIDRYTLQAAFLPADNEDRVAFSLTFDFDSVNSGPFSRPRDVPRSDIEEELVEFYEGMDAYNSLKYKEAYDKFNRVLDINPRHELAARYRDRALLHLKSENWLDEEDAKLIALHRELALKYESQGLYGDAIAEWRKLLEINPADSDAERNIDRIKRDVQGRVAALHKAGLDEYTRNEKIKAIENFSKALTLNPEYEPSRNWLVKIKQELSQAELQERERIERIQKAEVLYNRGLSYYGRKTWEEAIKEFDACLALNPEHPNAPKYRALAIEELEAEKSGLKGIEAANAMYQKGMLNYNAEKFYAAAKDFRMALRAYPAHRESSEMLPKAQSRLEAQIRPFLNEGKIGYRNKKFSDAEIKFQGVLQLDPENAEAQEYLEKMRKEREAAITFHFSEGSKAFQTRDFSKTIYHMDEVVKLDPTNREAQSLLAQSQAAVKDRTDALHKKALGEFNAQNYDEALLSWRNVLVIDPANALALKYIAETENKKKESRYSALAEQYTKDGKIFFENRDYERALNAFEKVLELDKTNVTALQYRDLCKAELEKENQANEVNQLFVEGVREYKKREYEKAIVKWKQVKKLDPQNVLVDRYIEQANEAARNRKVIDFINGEKFYKEGKWLLAKSSFERAIQEDPKNQKARSRLQDTNDRIAEDRSQFISEGDTAMRASEYEKAANSYMAAYRLDNSPESQQKRDDAVRAGELFANAGKYMQSDTTLALAISAYLRVLEINPFDKKASDAIGSAKARGKSRVSSWMQEAKAAEDTGDFRTSYSLLQSVESVEPENADAKKGLARVRSKLRSLAAKPYSEGKEAMAIRNYALAIEKFTEVETILPDYEDNKSLLSEARKQRSEARAQKSADIASGKSSPASENDLNLVNQGIVLYRQGKYKEAIDTWNRVPKSSEAYSKAQKYIARAKLKL